MICFPGTDNKTFFCMETIPLGDLHLQTVLDCGFYMSNMKRDPNNHRHLNNELFVVEKGFCRMECGKELFDCKMGTLVLIPAGTDHHVCGLSDDASIYSLRFSCCPVTDVQNNLSVCIQVTERLGKPLKWETENTLLPILHQLRHELVHQNFLFEEKFRSLLQAFYVDVLRVLLDIYAPSPPENSFIMKNPGALKKIQSDIPSYFYMDILDNFFTHLPLDAPTLSTLSSRLCLSTSQTHRLVKNYYGMSFQQKLIQAKIEQGKRLIATSNLSLYAIAEQVGYRSYNAFFEAFLKQTGQTPSDYKQTQTKWNDLFQK